MVDSANTGVLAQPRIALGLRENWQQFTLLVLINAFVGGMVGLERTLVPLIGSETFQLASTVAVTSFIISFGIIKAITNLVSGQLADTWGRKKTSPKLNELSIWGCWLRSSATCWRVSRTIQADSRRPETA